MSRTTLIAAGVAIAVAAIVAVLWIFLSRPSFGPGATAGAERAAEAREFIADVRKPGPESYADAYKRAQAFQEDGHLADAQAALLLCGSWRPRAFGIRAGDDERSQSSFQRIELAAGARPFQAYKWYSAALAHGSKPAASATRGTPRMGQGGCGQRQFRS